MMKKLPLIALALALVSCHSERAFVFSYFDTVHEEAGLCLAYSYDGYHWTALNDNKPVLAPTVGEDKLMRDPSICLAPDGTFHMVWTTSWHDDIIGYASSPDLIHWSEQKAIPVMKDFPSVRNCWAPELFYCKEEGIYYIMWASVVPDSEEIDRSGSEKEPGGGHRIYYTTTTDFETFSPTRLYFNSPYTSIDAAVVQDPITKEYVMVIKDDPEYVDMHVTRTRSMAEGFPTKMASVIHDDDNKEGPSPLFLNKTDLIVFFDRYMKHTYGAVLSRDHGDTWEDVSSQIEMPEGMSHGTAIRVDRKVVEKLKAAFPSTFSCQDQVLKNDIAYSWAKSEADRWTGELQKITPLDGKKLSVSFKYDPSMEELGQFAYSFDKSHLLTLTSSDATGIADALYTFCESLGITYDITGAMLPEKVEWDNAVGIDSLVTPHVRWRGIRQHVNFCMDISAYPMPLAKEYLQNLARMRFNKLVIHSYPFQWYEEDITGETNYAGSFFYGDVPRTDGWDFLDKLCKATNDSIFCIPEAEPLFGDTEKRSEFAMNWMRELITHAKEVGLRVQFSCENRAFDVEQTKKLAYRITDLYPIDDLEFITEEMGGWNEDMEYATAEVDTAAEAIRQLEADPDFQGRVGQLKLGIYCVLGNRIGDLFRHAREILPEHPICVLSQYASRGVAGAYPKFITDAEDLKWTELYSWTEFDGQMFLQQNHVDGIEDLLSQMDATAPGAQHKSLLFNHWRTAENRTSMRYAAEATLMGGRHREDFYRDYAASLGVKNVDAFMAVQDSIEVLHAFNLEHHGNVGFPPMSFWDNLGQHVGYGTDNLKYSSDAYLTIGEMLTDLYNEEDSQYAKEYLALMGNRVLFSKLYLDTVINGKELLDIPDIEKRPLSISERKKVNAICTKCIAEYEQALQIFANQLPDRGSLGTMAAVWNGPVRGMMYLNHKFGGAPLEHPSVNDVHLDLPPLPTFAK